MRAIDWPDEKKITKSSFVHKDPDLNNFQISWHESTTNPLDLCKNI